LRRYGFTCRRSRRRVSLFLRLRSGFLFRRLFVAPLLLHHVLTQLTVFAKQAAIHYFECLFVL
jgi:hypothetical protein